MKPPKAEIKAIIFDLGNVLIHYDPYRAARQFARACKVSLWKVWLHFFTSPVEKAYTTGKISSYDFFCHAREVFKTPVTYKEFCHYWNDIFWENEGMDELLRRLKTRYPLYLISNTNELHFNHIRKTYAILRHFKKKFPSHLMGHRKPEREIYEKALARVRLRPEQTLFIDDVPAFVEGARKAGMHAIRFRNQRQLIKHLRQWGIEV